MYIRGREGENFRCENFRHTHPVGLADSLVVDAIALVGQQWSIPVALIGLVVSDGESQRAVDAGRWELSSEVIR